MGKIEAQSSINHFSHPHHPLKLVSLQASTSNRTIICSACTKQVIGQLVYICESCNYCLHKPCSALPQTLIHKVDQNHTLNLLPTPAYEERAFQCNACGVLGTGFSYHCAECQIDLHTVCAFMRSSVKNSAHHHHALQLCFDPPYENKAFICDVCGESGSNHWLYRCDMCGFDAHLKCAKRPIVQHDQDQSASKVHQVPNQQPAQSAYQKPHFNSLTKNNKSQRPQIFKSKSVHSIQAGQYSPPVFQQPQVQVGVPLMPEPDPFRSQSYSSYGRLLHYNTAPMFSGSGFPQVQQPQAARNDVNMVQSVIEGFIEGAFNQIGQAALQGALGN